MLLSQRSARHGALPHYREQARARVVNGTAGISLRTGSCGFGKNLTLADKEESRSPLIPLQTHKASKAMLGKGSSLAGAALPSCQSPLPWDFNMLATWEQGNYTDLCKNREKHSTGQISMPRCPSSPPSSIFPS